MNKTAFDKNLITPPPRRFWGNKNPRSAETLLEAIIAISIITLLLAPASALYVSSIHTLSANKNDLVSVPFADEGVEMVKNMRDTNLLRFSVKAKDCWDAKPGPAVTIDNCTDNKITDGDYTLTLNPDTLAWDLIPGISYVLRLDAGKTSLYFTPPDPNMANRGDATPFSRKINITKLDFNGDLTDDSMQVSSVVSYQAGSAQKEIKRLGLLTSQPD